jgi:hypothetical protein
VRIFKTGASVLRTYLVAAIAGALLLSGTSRGGAVAPPHVAAASPVEGGRYLVVITGCNHCHTVGWEQSDGHTPESQWLKGSHAPGPGGQASPNLRLITQSTSRTSFAALFRRKQPAGMQMPFFNTRYFSDADLNSIYDFIRSLK